MESPESLSFEFSGSQNELIQDLAQKMLFVSYFLIAVGVLNVVSGVIALGSGQGAGGGSIIGGVLTILVGVWTRQAGASFKAIVDTQGNDVENLMGALGELRKLYTLQFWLLIVTLVFVAIALLLALFALLQ